MDQLYILLDVLIAAVLGGALGFEREWMNKPAGLRTNMIIAAASALFIALGRFIILDYETLIPDVASGVDPIRILNAVILGVSVLGAGTIVKGVGTDQVKYLTTSATILMSSAVGICVALNLYWLAVGATVLILIINRVLRYVGDLIARKSNHARDES